MKAAAAVPGVAVLLSLLAWPPHPARAAEGPPAQGTRLRFQKTLFIHTSPDGRVFTETRTVDQESTLVRVLAAEYGVPAEATEPLVAAFRKLNPGIDPDRIPAGQAVRVPFKIEEGQAAPNAAELPGPDTYVVRKGDSLWRVLKSRYKIARDAMSQALNAVARANPGIRDLNHLLVGQKINVPGSLTGQGAGEAQVRQAGSGLSRTVLRLLEELGCQVTTSGEAFLPLTRGRTVRLDAQAFPLATGPSGRRVVLDPASRLSAALMGALEQSWNYTVLQGTEVDPLAYLEKLLPRLGFYELTEGLRKAAPALGVELLADALWTVVPRQEDLWEGRVHFVFPSEAALDPDLVSLAVKSGYSVHLLGGGPAELGRAATPRRSVRVPELPMADPAKGKAALLDALGVPNRVRPDVEIDLGGGVRYELKPELTFDHAGTSYAVPPREPRRAEALLARAGYFTIAFAEPSTPLDQLGDLLALLGLPTSRVTVEVPTGKGLRLRVEGLALAGGGLAKRLYPDDSPPPGARVLLTLADVPPNAAGVLLREGFLPWLVRLPGAPPIGPAR